MTSGLSSIHPLYESFSCFAAFFSQWHQLLLFGLSPFLATEPNAKTVTHRLPIPPLLYPIALHPTHPWSSRSIENPRLLTAPSKSQTNEKFPAISKELFIPLLQLTLIHIEPVTSLNKHLRIRLQTTKCVLSETLFGKLCKSEPWRNASKKQKQDVPSTITRRSVFPS